MCRMPFIFILISVVFMTSNPLTYCSPHKAAGIKSRQKKQIYREEIPIEEYDWIGFGVNGSLVNNPDISTIYNIELSSGKYVNYENYIQLTGGYGIIEVKDNSSLRTVIDKNLSLYSLGIEFKTYLFTYYKTKPYIIFGIGYNLITWKYVDPVELTDGYFIKNDYYDRLHALDLHTGFGFNVMDNINKHCRIEFTSGIILPSGKTYYEFNNDLFQSTIYLKMKLGLYYAYLDF